MQVDKIYLVLFGFVFLVGCGSSEDKNLIKEDIKFEEITSEEKKQIKEVVYNMPSPMQAAMMLKDVGAIYMSDVLNPVENESNYYGSNHVTALNLGIYGADLGYSCVYVQVQDAFAYLRTARNMSESLGILGAFENDMISRFDKNLDNRDSIMTIVSQSFELTDKYLMENERSNVSALIIAGSWIEGVYLSTKVVQKYPQEMDEKLREKVLAPITLSIAEQKPALLNLISLLEIHKENKDISKLISKLKDLNKAYANVIVELKENPEVKVTDEGITTIDNESNVVISPESLAEITIIIDNIRNSITKKRG